MQLQSTRDSEQLASWVQESRGPIQGPDGLTRVLGYKSAVNILGNPKNCAVLVLNQASIAWGQVFQS